MLSTNIMKDKINIINYKPAERRVDWKLAATAERPIELELVLPASKNLGINSNLKQTICSKSQKRM